MCCGTGCDQCGEGYWQLEECPRRYLGSQWIEAAKLVRHAKAGHWPVPGGLLAQSSWFVRLVEALTSDVDKIDSKRLEELRKR